jgi:hypothetical protein
MLFTTPSMSGSSVRFVLRISSQRQEPFACRKRPAIFTGTPGFAPIRARCSTNNGASSGWIRSIPEAPSRWSAGICSSDSTPGLT